MKLDEKDKEAYFKFLEALRESAVTNMFGASPYLRVAFPELSLSQAREVLTMWMQSHKRAECK